MKEFSRKKVLASAGIILGVCIIASTIMSVFAVTSLTKVEGMIEAENGEAKDVAQENDITIMGEYKVESTEKISDAYKSGKTSGLDDKEKETLKLASDVLKEIVTKDMSDYEKEKAVYKWMIDNIGEDKGLLTVIPSSEEDSDNPYGVLKYRNAVCVGYATTFRLFMQMLDIDCMVVHNTEMFHTWDLVKLDGKWYHTDVYSDASEKNYANFNMSDSIAELGNSWNKDFFPKADGSKYCYAYNNKEMAKDIYDMPQAIKNAIDNKKYAFVIGFDKQPREDDGNVANTIMNSLVSRINVEASDAYLEWNWIQSDDSKYLLVVNIIGMEKNNNEKITNKQAQKIGKNIAKAFGDKEEWPVSYNDEGSWEEEEKVEEGK